MSKDNTMVIALLVGAYLLTKRQPVMAGGAGSAAMPYNGGSRPMNNIPSSVGSGVGQALGGALGGFIKNMWGGSGGTYDGSATTPYVTDGSGAMPVPNYDEAYQQNPELLDNITLYGV